MEIINNTWLVGILGGIISALLFYPIGEYLNKKLNKKEHKRVIKEVNTKISKILIMSISEGVIPSPHVIRALLSSLAKRNNVEIKDINTVEDTYDDLVYELFETIFISVENKQILAEQLIEQKLSIKQISDSNLIAIGAMASKMSSPSERKLVGVMPSLILSIAVVTIIGVSSTILSLNDFGISAKIVNEDPLTFLASLLTAFSLVTALLAARSTAKITAKTKEEFEKKKKLGG